MTIRATSTILAPFFLAAAVVTAQTPAGRRPVPTSTPLEKTQAPPVFRTGVSGVRLDVTPRDPKTGAFVPGLSANDFQVFEDGVEQKITGFWPWLGGRQIGGMTTSNASAGLTNEGLILHETTPKSDAAGRLFIVFIDDLHLTPDLTPQVKTVLKQIRDKVIHENDLVGFVSSGYSSIALDPAYDFGHRRFDEVINKVMGSGATIKEIIDMPQGGDGLAELNHKVQVAFSTAAELLDQLESVADRRKAFIYVSSGYSLNPLKDSRLKAEEDKYNDISGSPSTSANGDGSTTNGNGANGDQSTATDKFGRPTMEFKESDLLRQLAELINTTKRANTQFFAVDPRGLMAGPDVASLGFQLPYSDWRDYVTMTTSTLRSLSEETGGVAAVDTNDFGKWLQQVDNMTSDYYILAYQSSNPDPLHPIRKIEVRVKKPGVRLEPGKDYKELLNLKKASKPVKKQATASGSALKTTDFATS